MNDLDLTTVPAEEVRKGDELDIAGMEAMEGWPGDERDVLAAKVELVWALHYAADNDGARTPICETCHGKAGVHECGCWAERDREPVCGHCMDGWHGASVPWPCPTIRALDGEADR